MRDWTIAAALPAAPAAAGLLPARPGAAGEAARARPPGTVECDLSRSARHIYNARHDREHCGTPDIEQRQASRERRIGHALCKGAPAWQEARGRRGEQRNIDIEERRYRSGGALARDERRDLQDLKATSRHIHEESHDNHRR